MKIKDITLDDIRKGNNWKVTSLEKGCFPDVPLEELSIEKAEAFESEDNIVYSTIFVTDSGAVKPLVTIKEVQGREYGGDSCEFVDGRWRQVGLEPNPNAPAGTEYFANPLEQDPSFVADYDFRKWHREGFKKFISLL
jgi:hypothetical protein